MTDMEKLAAVVKKRMGLGSYTASIIASDLFRGRKALNISVDQLHGLIEGTHVVVPVEPTEAEIEQVARALAREDLGSNVDLSSCADEESDAEWTFYTVEARVAYKTVIAAIQGDL